MKINKIYLKSLLASLLKINQVCSKIPMINSSAYIQTPSIFKLKITDNNKMLTINLILSTYSLYKVKLYNKNKLPKTDFIMIKYKMYNIISFYKNIIFLL